MSETPQETPEGDPSSPVDDLTPEAAKTGEALRDEAGSSESKKPWWKFWG
jgi:hypothetical protein